MKVETVLEKVNRQREEGERDLVIRNLRALLIITPESKKLARSYLEKAIEYIEKN